MSAVEDYLDELRRLLQVRGSVRRRLLGECRDHLEESAAAVGPTEAVRRFGDAAEIAASLDAEVATRRAQRATLASAVGVIAVGGSTLVVLNSTTAATTGSIGWAVTFFAAAQVAVVSLVLAVVQAGALRGRPASAGEVSLLCARNGCALLAASVTLFAAAGAVPGHGAAVLILGGPVLAALAATSVLRARSVIRGYRRPGDRPVRSPLTDLGAFTHLSLPEVGPGRLLVPTAFVAAVAAFARDRAEHSAMPAALTTAGVEIVLVVLGMALLGPALGLRARWHHL
ncbi:hypothetical protein [Allobranchiibius sp. GilTou38]|uniref:HAAS signaling domain-containing protein n=1 Tax=Allobranchiibius sp. GilTou38 TaxID=2815210 RepID=UPI001AA17165|nr:hypothetical protein [Allobranchiibius sp. GilTou38]MBO1766178.1 hypothetical protein [Allobranchiibius sp. GilTou38]